MSTGLAVLWFASRIVPRRQRAEWLDEWRAELWYVREQGGPAAFCWGAFRDAWWMRRNHPPSLCLAAPLECLGWLVAVALTCALLCYAIPGARRVLLPFPYQDAERLVLLSPIWKTGSGGSAITVGQYRRLARSGEPFEDLAFYRVVRTRHGARELSLAVASENLFPLLGVAAPPRRAVVPVDQAIWLLPGRVDAVRADDDAIAALPAGEEGYAIGRVHPDALALHPHLPESDASGPHAGFRVRPLRSYPGYALPAVVLISLLVASATAPMRLRVRARRCPRWIFLGAKFVLLIFTDVLIVVILQALVQFELRPLMMPLFVVSFRWALVDQHQRCPECLCRLQRPVRIGVPSQTFLEWYGTESFCGSGHGLLQAPELSAASSDRQQWLPLDESWATIPFRI